MIRARTVSAPTRVARKVSVPVVLSVPPTTRSSHGRLATGRLSPVIMLSSTLEAPSTTTPSTAIVSPGRTRTRSPTRTSAIGTSSSPPSRISAGRSRREADRGGGSRRTVWLRARASRYRPSRISVMIAADGIEVQRQGPAAHAEAGGPEEVREPRSSRRSTRRRRTCRPRSACSCRRRRGAAAFHAPT